MLLLPCISFFTQTMKTQCIIIILALNIQLSFSLNRLYFTFILLFLVLLIFLYSSQFLTYIIFHLPEELSLISPVHYYAMNIFLQGFLFVLFVIFLVSEVFTIEEYFQ